ncbi:MAG: hypothetical protein KKA64_00025 [Nanoarchaeota archaeon]|nr:hypothetical protein [Nanoarchaeota archaeon]
MDEEKIKNLSEETKKIFLGIREKIRRPFSKNHPPRELLDLVEDRETLNNSLRELMDYGLFTEKRAYWLFGPTLYVADNEVSDKIYHFLLPEIVERKKKR